MLVDANYLSDLFRREFTDAAARILTAHETPPLPYRIYTITQDLHVNPDNPVNLVKNDR